MTVTPPFWGFLLGAAVVVGALVYGAFLVKPADIEADVRRTRRIPESEIDTEGA